MSDELRRLIQDAGGLVTQAEMAKRWNISRQRIQELVAMPGFPKPVNPGDRYKLYAWFEVEAWRKLERPTGRPRKASTTPR
jgi:hypothetical protein